MRKTGLKQLVASLPGIVVPLLPKGACPLCLGAYGAVLSSLGLGFLATDRVLTPVTLAALAITVGSIAIGVRGHRTFGPLIVAIISTVAVVAGRFVWEIPVLLYLGLATLFAASFWNLWLGRRKPEPPLIQLRNRPQGGTS